MTDFPEQWANQSEANAKLIERERLITAITDFLKEIDESYFPRTLGDELSLDSHDPPFTEATLRNMEKKGLILLNEKKRTYRLTLKATEWLKWRGHG